MAEWLGRMRAIRVLDVVSALGFDTEPHGAANVRRRGLPCPACGAERRHTKTRDKRGAVGTTHNGNGWHCFQCEAGGDALDFVAAHFHGRRWRELGDSNKAGVREWCLQWLGLGPSWSTPAQTAVRQPASPPLSTPAAEPPSRYPPAEEVEALWHECCTRVDEVGEVAAWLRQKRLDAQAIADRDLARALLTDDVSKLPKWARRWARNGHLLIAQLVDHSGAVRSVLARNVRGREPKTLSIRGFERRGLVLACGVARQVLQSCQKPDWWPRDVPLRFEVCEGEKKWCMRVTEDGNARALRGDACEHAPAVIGIESGSWTSELAQRLPDDSTVFIATDCNEAGVRYADQIMRSLDRRIRHKTLRVELRNEHRYREVES